jgi:hypothetical protein
VAAASNHLHHPRDEDDTKDDADAADDAASHLYSSAWERCLVEILARLVTSKEYVVGLYKLKSVETHSLKAPGFNP